MANYGASRLVKFSPDGELLGTWVQGAKGPLGIAVDADGRVFVTEYDANQIQVLAPDGTRLGSWGTPGERLFVAPVGIALDRHGAVYVSDSPHGVQKFRLLPPPRDGDACGGGAERWFTRRRWGS